MGKFYFRNKLCILIGINEQKWHIIPEDIIREEEKQWKLHLKSIGEYLYIQGNSQALNFISIVWFRHFNSFALIYGASRYW